MKFPKGKKLLRVAAAGVIASSSLLSLAFASSAYAGSLTNVEVRFDKMKVSTATTGTVCAKPASTGTEANVTVTFPTGYTLGTATNFAVDTTNTAWPTGATAWPSIATATNVTGQVVTFPSGDLTVGTLYCFNWDNSAAVTQPASSGSNEAGSVATLTSGSTTIDSAPYATATLTDNTIVVTATVPPLFSFSLSANSDPLGTVTSTALSETNPGARPSVTVSTNAKNGWQVWASDNNTGLKSTQANYTISSHTGQITLGNEFYNTGVFSKSQVGGAGTVSVIAGFDDTTDNHSGGGLTPSLQTVATSTGTADTSTLTLVNNIGIKNTTPAATDYSDTQNWVAAALF